MQSLLPSRIFALLLAACITLTAMDSGAQQVGGGLGASQDEPEAPPESDALEEESDDNAESEGDDSRAVDAIIEQMSIPEKVSQLMFVRLNGNLSLTSADRELLTNLPPGGVMMPIVGEALTTSAYTQSIQALTVRTRHRIPLFISGNGFAQSDNAGRGANRFVLAPTLLTMAAAGISAPTTEFIDRFAEGTSLVGINVHFGPNLSLSGDTVNHVTTLHTFGDSPEFTADITGELMNAFRKYGVEKMPAGFPGGNANRVAADPAVLLTPGKYYLESDGLPYFMAIQNGAKLIHVGNTLVPTLEEDSRPASISRRAIKVLLRGTLQYDGVVVAGPIDSPQMIRRYDPEISALGALESGADMIMWSKVTPQIPQVIAVISEAIERGVLDEAEIDRSLKRILQAKKDLGIFEQPFAKDRDVRKLKRKDSDGELLMMIERNAITLLKNDNNMLPLTRDASTPLLLSGMPYLKTSANFLKKELKDVVRWEPKSAKHVTRVEDFELRRLQDAVLGAKTAVFIFDSLVSSDSQAQMISIAKKVGAKVVVVLLGHPASVDAYSEADAILLTYSSSVFPDFTLESVMRILVGDAPIRVISSEEPLVRRAGEKILFNVLDVIQSPTGRLPLNVPPRYEHGHYMSFPPTSIKKVRWEFGDGGSSSKDVVEHSYAVPGSYTATLTVVDDDGVESTGTFAITIQ